MTHNNALTPNAPRRQQGLATTGTAVPPVALRQMATGETEETARDELPEAEHLIPTPAPEQARGEARIFHALITAFGRHRRTLTGGPFGIRSLTPRTDELVVRIAPAQTDRWIDALAHRPGGTGVAGLRWAGLREGIALTLPGMRLLLADISETDWRAALGRRSADQSSLMPHWIPQFRDEPEYAATQDTELASLADHLCATLRRIRLLDALTRISGHVHLFTARHHGNLYLFEACEATPTVLPLWTSRPVPPALWPAGPIPAPGPADPHTAVLDLLTETEPARAPSNTAEHPAAARALCHIAGLNADPVLVQAAEHVLDVATRVLADPAHASVYAAGGWAGSCRTYPEGTVHGSDPCLPPGAEIVADLPEEDLQRLGRHFCSRPSDTSRSDLVSAGQVELVHLFDWALAAATRPAHRPGWTRGTDGTLQHTRPLPDRDGTLNLTATTTGVYRVSLDALGLSDLADEDDTVEWEREAAPSQSAAVLLAEHAAIEAAVCLPFQRGHHKQRLLLPAPVSAEPTIRSVIAGADYVLRFFTFASVLGRLHERVVSAQGAADGHWRTDPLSDTPATLTALISDWCALPSPHHGEAANTATVDSPAYLRHLVAHRAALDPFVTRYLAAADSLPGARTFDERHLAGCAALRTTDLSDLACSEVRPTGERLLRLVRSIPQDPAQLTAWYEHHLVQA